MNDIKNLNIIFRALALIALCGQLASCQKMDEAGKGGAEIRFDVRTVETKGAINTTLSLNTSGQSFNIIAVADEDGTGNYFEAMAKYDGSNWNTFDIGGTRTDYLWLNDVGIHFWSYYPVSLGTATGSAVRTVTEPEPYSDVLSFSYSQPAATAGSDATNQKDIIFAGNSEIRKFDSETGEIESGDETVNITFYHALSEIRFAVSTNDGSFDPTMTISNVAIINAAGSGDCDFTLPSSFKWSNPGSRFDYSQDYGILPGATNSEWEVGTYTHNSVTKNLYTTLNPFFLIPESDLSELSVEVTFKTSLGDCFTKNVALSGSWEAGCYYTYKIGATLSTTLDLTLSLLEWDFIEQEYDYTAGPAVTPGTGELQMTNETAAGSKTVVADTPIEARFTLDTPLGATWLVSVTNTDAFEVYTIDATGSENPASGTIQNGALGIPSACVFYIRAKTGIDRSAVLSTKLHITVRLADGTYVNVDDLLGVNAWNIILNPLG